MLLDGQSYEIIGVAAGNAGMREFGSAPEVYVPFQIDVNSRDESNFFKVVARLTPGITLDQARDRLQAFANENRSKYPNTIGNQGGFTVTSLRNALMGNIRPLLRILICAVGLVLLISCANVANLLLVQASKRRGEIAIRVALGASRGRLIRQLLEESVLLSVLGGGLGAVLGYAGIRTLLAVNTADLPLVGQNGSAVTIDWRLFGFAFAISIVTGIAFGLFPALQASRLDVNATLKGAARSGTGFRQNKARASFVMSETCLAVILMIGAALLIRSFIAIYSVDRGIATDGVITMRTLLTGPKYAKTSAAADTIRIGLEQIRSIPGIEAAGAGCCLPLNDFYGLPFNILGPLHNDNSAPDGVLSVVSPGFFKVFQIPVKRGRTFTDRDDANSPPVVMISEQLAKTYWRNRDPLLDRIVIGDNTMEDFKNDPPRQIIGIVGDTRNAGLNTDPTVDRVMYVPQPQLSNAENEWLLRNGPMAWIVRTQSRASVLVPTIRERLQRSTGLPVSDIRSMDEVMSLSTGRQRFNMLLMTIFGCTALLLAAIGIYGLMAFTVEQRMREIGIRLALGANAAQVRNMVIFQGMRLAVIGVAVGVGAAWGLSRFIESLLFGVKAMDMTVFLTIPLLLIGVALLAVWLPARRTRAANPIDCLRSE
jgi:predicted permease